MFDRRPSAGPVAGSIALRSGSQRESSLPSGASWPRVHRALESARHTGWIMSMTYRGICFSAWRPEPERAGEAGNLLQRQKYSIVPQGKVGRADAFSVLTSDEQVSCGPWVVGLGAVGRGSRARDMVHQNHRCRILFPRALLRPWLRSVDGDLVPQGSTGNMVPEGKPQWEIG